MLADLILAILLGLNAAVILNEERFLNKIGWGYEQTRNEPPSMKKQIVSMLHASRMLLTIPLFFINLIVILLKLVIG